MSHLFKVLVVYLAVLLTTNNITRAQTPYPHPDSDPNYTYSGPAPSATQRFHQRLNAMYNPSNQNTFGQQIVYGSVEMLAFYKLGSILSHADKQTIESVRLQLSALEDTRNIDGYVRDVSERERTAKITALKKKLKSLEGGIMHRLGSGVARFAIRGTQAYLILSIGSRIYVMNVMGKDPSFFPLPKIACSGIDCDMITERLLSTRFTP